MVENFGVLSSAKTFPLFDTDCEVSTASLVCYGTNKGSTHHPVPSMAITASNSPIRQWNGCGNTMFHSQQDAQGIHVRQFRLLDQ